jgi:RNA polymerase sigma-70 factor (ECF subfamily)
MIDSYKTLIYELIFNKLSNEFSKEDIEKYISDIYFEIFKYKIDSKDGFNKVLSAIRTKRKIIDMYRRNTNNNKISLDDAMHLHAITDDIVRSILLKENNLELANDIKSLGESDSEMIIRKYHLNQSLRDISKNTGLKVSTYA